MNISALLFFLRASLPKNLFIYILLCLSACQSPAPETLVSDREYFPLETGRYIIYDVEEQQYALNAAPIRGTYQVKELTGNSYTDATGQPTFRLLRYRRSTDAQPWQADSVWAMRVESSEAIRTENGRDFVQLVFPVGEALRWDGNRRNNLGPQTYSTRNAGQLFSVSGKMFSQTVTVQTNPDSTLVSRHKNVAVYARQVGLIYRERTNLTYCTATPACIGKNQIDYGRQEIYRINSFGRE